MKNNIKYLIYLFKHKWFVMIECFKFGLFIQGITHDLSKFSKTEFSSYVNFFYGKNSHIYKNSKKKNGYCKPFETGDPEFDYAWLMHCRKNKHHWQWWIFPREDCDTQVLPMEEKYLKEMICDWVGAGKALGSKSPKDDPYLATRQWYLTNKEKIRLADSTRVEVEKIIGVQGN